MKILHIVGARPNFIKIKPILTALRKYRKVNAVLVHTGQHFDRNMSGAFFKDLKIPRPEYNLGVGAGSHAYQTSVMMQSLEKVFDKERPDIVLVVGDVNSTLAASLVASKMGIKIAHVEAGLRSYDRTMPEEINRVITDQLSDYLFTTSTFDNANLVCEGVDMKKIHVVGNVMVDTLRKYNSKIISAGKKYAKDEYAVLTLHRPGNVDDSSRMKKIMKVIQKVSSEIKIICPVHPRTIKEMKKQKINRNAFEHISFIAPVGYIDFLGLCSSAKLVLTDSGGLQVETTMLNIPCITLRDNTEWHITLDRGTNILAGIEEKKVMHAVKNILKGEKKLKQLIPKWDGRSSERIVKILAEK